MLSVATRPPAPRGHLDPVPTVLGDTLTSAHNVAAARSHLPLFVANDMSTLCITSVSGQEDASTPGFARTLGNGPIRVTDDMAGLQQT